VKNALGGGLLAVIAAAGLQHSFAANTDDLIPRESAPYPANLLQRVRQAATTVPGKLAEAINFVKVAESHRTYAAVIEGGSEDPFISARSAFQIVYPDGSIMLDSGMDETVHRFYGFGRVEPYWPDVNDTVQAALRRAQLIIITHEHGECSAATTAMNSRQKRF